MRKDLYARENYDKDSGITPADPHLSLSPKLLLSVHETAELLGVSRRTVFVLLASGELTRRKVRRRTMIHREEVIQFAAGMNSQAEPEQR